MRKVVRLLTLSAVVGASTLSAFAQQPAATAAPAQADAAKACTDLYTKWRENYKGDANLQKTAYEAGKEYLSKCPSDDYVSYVQKWIPKYEKAVRSVEFESSITNKNYPRAFELGRQIQGEDPDNVLLAFRLAAVGLTAGEQFKGDTANFARKALQLIESGKGDTADWKTLNIASKSEAVGWLHYTLGFINYKTMPGEAAQSFIKALQVESPVKKNATAYYLLAIAYQNSEYAPLAQDYQNNCAGKDLTDECKLKYDKLNLVVDRVIDALARSVSLATDPKLANDKANWMKQLEGFYKFRNEDKTDGLDAMIAGIQSKPLLLPSMQTMPTPAPSATTAPSTSTTPSAGGNGSTTPGTSSAPASTSTNSSNKPASTTTNPSTAAKPKP